MELRKYECSDCNSEFWVDGDADNYPIFCPYCETTNINGTIETLVVDIS